MATHTKRLGLPRAGRKAMSATARLVGRWICKSNHEPLRSLTGRMEVIDSCHESDWAYSPRWQ